MQSVWNFLHFSIAIRGTGSDTAIVISHTCMYWYVYRCSISVVSYVLLITMVHSITIMDSRVERQLVRIER